MCRHITIAKELSSISTASQKCEKCLNVYSLLISSVVISIFLLFVTILVHRKVSSTFLVGSMILFAVVNLFTLYSITVDFDCGTYNLLNTTGVVSTIVYSGLYYLIFKKVHQINYS